MNRLLLPCLLLLAIFSAPIAKSQNFAIWTSQSGSVAAFCYTPNVVITHTAGVVAPQAGATHYTWTIEPPAGCTTPVQYTCGGTVPAQCDTIVNMSFSCCGTYTVVGYAVNAAAGNQTIATAYALVQIICPNTATATATPSVICRGDQSQLLGNGGGPNTYTWLPSTGGSFTNNPQPVSPLQNTTYTMLAVSPQGCTVAATTTVLVQGADVTVTPLSQTMCSLSPVCFTASAQANTGSSVTPLTSTTALNWYSPSDPNNSFATGYTTCTPAVQGNYSVVLTHTGSAGTCTSVAVAAVNIGTNISITANSNTNSACPGQTITLSAASIQTAAASYTWTTPANTTFTGNPVTINHTGTGVYTVDVDYFGCPGQATVFVGTSTLTPTLTTIGGGSICPNSCATLVATGGALNFGAYSYTFAYVDQNSIVYPIAIPTSTSTGSLSAVHCPTVNPPVSYSVYVENVHGCSGGAFLTVQIFNITPSFGTAKPAYCNNTEITFTVGNVGAGASYTAGYAASPTTIYSGTNNTFTYTPPPGTLLAQTFTLEVDSGGCKGNAFVTVNPFNIQPVLTASSASICPATTFSMYSTGGAGTTFSFFTALPPNLITSGTTYSVAHTPSVGTTYPAKFFVRVDSANCQGTDTIQIGTLDLSSRLTLSVAPGVSVCPNTTFTLSGNMASGSTYSFFAPGTGTIPLQTANSATSSLSTFTGNTTYTVHVDSAGCTGIDSLKMELFILKTQLSANPNPVCSGMPVVLSATGGTNTFFTFLKPQPPPVFAAVIGNSATPTPTVQDNPGPTTATEYTVFADSLGCNGIATVSVNISPGLVVNAFAASPTVCSGASNTLSVSGPTNATYSWSQITGTNNPVPVAGGTSLNYSTALQGIIINPTVNTQYILYAVDPAGCTGTAAVTVSINPTASLTMVISPSSQTICSSMATLVASGANSYTWYPSAGLSPSATNPTVTTSPPSTQVYTVVGANNLGCFGSATTQVQVGPDPKTTLTLVPTAYSVCAGYNATLTAFGAASYTWITPNFSAVAQPSVAGPAGGYTLIGSNGGTCTHTITQTIGNQAPLNINVTTSKPTNTTCIEINFPNKKSQAVVLNASGAGSYIWQPYDPAYMTYSLGPQTTVRPAASTCYTVTGYSSTCSGQTVVCVTVIQQFSMAVTPNLPAICVGDTVKLSIVNIQPTLSVGPSFSYLWVEAENAPASLTSGHGGLLSPTVLAFPKNTTTYSVQVNDSRGCASLPRLVHVTVFPRPIVSVAIPTINNVPTNTVCFVGSHTGPPDVVLTLVAQNQNPNLPFNVAPTYTWLSPYKPPYVSILTPPNANQVTIGAPTRTPAVAIYTVVGGYNGVPGCAEMATVAVNVVDCRPVTSVTPPLFKMADGIDTLCSMECVTFLSLTDTMAGGPQTYFWEFEGGNPPTSTDKNPKVCYNLPPTNSTGYNVVLTVTNPYPKNPSTGVNGSTRTIGLPSFVKVVDIPAVTIVPPSNIRSDTTVRFGTPVKLQATGALTYSWSPNYNITSTSDPNVTVRPFRTTRYIVTGFNSKYCASRDTIDVIVIEDCGEMYVANAFSPNNDGHNDVLKVQGICLESLSFMIFNRWGQVVFETTDQSVGWDGTFKGEQLNTGVFVYRLEGKTHDGKAYSSKGNITLIR